MSKQAEVVGTVTSGGITLRCDVTIERDDKPPLKGWKGVFSVPVGHPFVKNLGRARLRIKEREFVIVMQKSAQQGGEDAVRVEFAGSGAFPEEIQ